MSRAWISMGLAFAVGLGACAKPPQDPAALVASARERMAKQDYAASMIHARNALQKDPNLGEARFILGRALLETGDVKSAELELRKAVELAYSSDEMTVTIARTLLAKGDLVGIVTEFSRKTLVDPKAQAELRALLGEAEILRNRLPEAERRFSEALSLDGANATGNLGLARIAAASGDFATALVRAEAALAAAPKNLQAHQLKAAVLAAQGNTDAATGAYKAAVQAAPKDLDARMSLIGHLMDQRAFDQAQTEVASLAKLAPADPSTLYAEAKLLMEKREYTRARQAALEVVRALPQHGPSFVIAGSAALQLGAYVEAEGDLRKAAFYEPDSIEAKRLHAVALLRMGRSAAAMGLVRELLGKAGRAPSVLALAAEAHLTNGDVAAAVRFYEQAKAVVPENASVRARLALLRMAAGDARRGYAELEAAAASDTEDYQPDLALVATNLRQRRPDRALAALAALENKRPNDPVIHNLRGLALTMKHEFASARQSFEQALTLSPTYLPAVHGLARLDLRERKPEAARKRYEALLEKDPANEQAMLTVATLLRLYGATRSEVEKVHRAAVSANPTSPTARAALVNYYLGERDYKAALSAAQDATAAIPQSPAMLETLGIAQMAAGEHLLAVTTFGRFADMLPKAPQPLMLLASAQVAARQPEDAVRSLRSALALQPDLAAAYRDLASIQVAMGKSEEAIKDARTLQAQRPQQALGYVMEGEIHVLERNWEAAERLYREATRKFDLGVLAARAHEVMTAAGKTTEAEALVEQWIQSHPKDVFVLNYLGDRELAARRLENAARRYSAALQRSPNSVRALNNLAWITHQLGRPAREYAERAHESAPDDPQVMDTLGVILVAENEIERGLELLGRASALAPQAHHIRLNFAKALIGANRRDAARRELDVLARLDKRNPVQQEAARLLGTP